MISHGYPSNVQTKGIKRKYYSEIDAESTSVKTAKSCCKTEDIFMANLKTATSARKFSANERLRNYRKNLEQKQNVCKVHTLLRHNSSTQNEKTEQTPSVSARITNIRQGTKLKDNTVAKKFWKDTASKNTHKMLNIDNTISANIVTNNSTKQQNVPCIIEQSSNSKQNETYNNSIEDFEMDWSPIDETEVVTDVSSL